VLLILALRKDSVGSLLPVAVQLQKASALLLKRPVDHVGSCTVHDLLKADVVALEDLLDNSIQ